MFENLYLELSKRNIIIVCFEIPLVVIRPSNCIFTVIWMSRNSDQHLDLTSLSMRTTSYRKIPNKIPSKSIWSPAII
jgi:predicted ATPase